MLSTEIFSVAPPILGIGDVLSTAWKILSSPIAVGIYVILVLISVIALICFLLAEEKNRPDPEMLQEYIERINEIKPEKYVLNKKGRRKNLRPYFFRIRIPLQ